MGRRIKSECNVSLVAEADDDDDFAVVFMMGKDLCDKNDRPCKGEIGDGKGFGAMVLVSDRWEEEEDEDEETVI